MENHCKRFVSVKILNKCEWRSNMQRSTKNEFTLLLVACVRAKCLCHVSILIPTTTILILCRRCNLSVNAFLMIINSNPLKCFNESSLRIGLSIRRMKR